MFLAVASDKAFGFGVRNLQSHGFLGQTTSEVWLYAGFPRDSMDTH